MRYHCKEHESERALKNVVVPINLGVCSVVSFDLS